MKALFPLILISLIFSACTSEAGKTDTELQLPEHVQNLENLNVIPADALPVKAIHFEEEVRFGEIYPALTPPSRGFGSENAIDENGYVYRTDKGQGHIQVFDSIGKKIGTIGRYGKGPGDFEDISAIYTRNDNLIVFDSNLLRVSIFDKNSFELSRIFTFDAVKMDDSDDVKFPHTRTLQALKDSAFLTAFLLEDRDGRSYDGYYAIDEQGEIQSNRLFEQQKLKMHTGTTSEGGQASDWLEFSSEGLFDVSNNGTIYHANTADFIISVINSGGEQTQSIYVPFKKAPLHKDEIEKNLSSHMKSIYKNVDYPETWPALADLFVDDENRIWVSTIIEDKSIREWWVLNNSGEIISKFTWPADDKIVDVKNGRFYVEEQEIKYQSAKELVSYKINFKEK